MKHRFITFVVIALLLSVGQEVMGQDTHDQPTWGFSGLVAEGGTWDMQVTLAKRHYNPSEGITLAIDITINSPGLAYNIDRVAGIYTLVTGIRTFNDNGDMIGNSHAMASTVLTGVGLPIEGEYHGLPTDRFGGPFHHPIDSYIVTPPSELEIDTEAGTIKGTVVHGILPGMNIPTGWYQLRIDMGVQIAERDMVTLWGVNPELPTTPEEEHTTAITGPIAIGTRTPPHMMWTIFSNSMPGGGVVAVEDRGYVACSRDLGFSETPILPMTDLSGGQRRYLLEPDFPLVWNSFMRTKGAALDLDFQSGWLEVRIANANGTIIDLGGAQFNGRRGIGATTLENQFVYSFSSYGLHRIEMTGWILDTSGQSYSGGGVYEVYVAKPIDIQTNVLPGTPLNMHDYFDTGFQLYPPVEADVEIQWELDPYSRGNPFSESFYATANRWGYYAPPIVTGRDRWERDTRIQFNDPGEYKVTFIATYREDDGTIWMGEKCLYGVVLPDDAIELASRPPAAGSFSITSDARYVPVPADTGNTVIMPIAGTPDLPTVYTFPIGFFIGNQIGFRSDDASLREIDSGAAGTFVTPGLATSSGLYPQMYSEDLDRRAYLISTVVRNDGYCQTSINEGSRYEHLPYPTFPWMPGELPTDSSGDNYHCWSAMIYRDLRTNSTTYGYYSAGIVLRDDITVPRVHQPETTLINDGWGSHNMILHNPAVRPGCVIQEGGTFTPSTYFLPLPATSAVQFVITPPFGDQISINLLGGTSGYARDWSRRFDLDYEGIWEVEMTLVQGTETGGILGTQIGDPWEFYVIERNNIMPIEFYLPSETPLNASTDIVVLTGDMMGGEMSQGTVHISATFNSSVVEQTTREIQNGAFVYSLSLEQISNSFRNFDAFNPHDRLVLTFFADGVTTGGSRRFAARTIYIQDGYLYTGEKEYSPIDPQTREEMMLELARRAESQLAHELRGRIPPETD